MPTFSEIKLQKRTFPDEKRKKTTLIEIKKRGTVNSGIFGQGWGNETFDWAMWPVNRAQCPQKGPHGPVGTSWAQVGPQVER